MSTGAAARPATERLAHYIADAEPRTPVPREVERLVIRAIIDTWAVTVAGGREDAFRVLRDVMDEEITGGGTATIIPTGERASPAQAALLNGTAGHALDYDDVTDEIYGHPSVALLPAVLAVAESVGAGGREIIDAYTTGFDTAVAVAAALPVGPHFERGWHATASVGVISATAALCRLLRLPVDQTRHALGIAGSQVSSSRQNFGTMTKPLHPGVSSWSAVLACRLAANGFTADNRQLESPLGYFATYGVDSDLDSLFASLDQPFALTRTGLNVKKYPCCYNTHRIADAAITLADAVQKRREAVTAVMVTVQPGGLEPLIHHRPTTGLEGKFSAEYVVAAALLDGEVALQSFTDEAVARPEAQQLLRRVELREAAVPPAGEPEWDFAYAVVEAKVGDETIQARVDIPRGDRRQPLTDGEVDAKFLSCLEFAGVDWDAPAMLTQIKGLPNVDRFTGLPPVPPT